MNFLEWQNRCRLFKSRMYTRMLRRSFGAIGQGSIINPPFLSFYADDIHIGANTHIASHAWIQALTSYRNQTFTPYLEIGDDTYIGRFSHIMACGHMKIGTRVVIADGVYITDNLHGFEDCERDIAGQELKLPGDVVIEDEVWIGERVSVLPDVTIGKHAVIGSHAVVTRDIPAYSVAVGVPARVVKQYNFTTKTWEKV